MVMFFSLFKMGLFDLPMTDSIVYLGVKFKFGYKLIIDFSIRSRKFLDCVCIMFYEIKLNVMKML